MKGGRPASGRVELVCRRVGVRDLPNKLAYLLAYIGFLSLWKSVCPTEHSHHAK